MLLFIGTLFAVLFTVFIWAVDGGLYQYLNLPSMFVILVPLLFFLCVSKSGRVLIGYIKTSFKKNHEYGQAELKSIATAVKNTMKIIHAAGGFGFILGFIAILASFSTPEMLGHSLSVSLIAVFYSIITSYFIFFPLRAWAENKMISEMNKTDEK